MPIAIHPESRAAHSALLAALAQLDMSPTEAAGLLLAGFLVEDANGSELDTETIVRLTLDAMRSDPAAYLEDAAALLVDL